MRLLAITVLLFMAVPTIAQKDEEGFTVEQLTPEQVKAIETADRELTAAQVLHAMALFNVKSAHGQSAGSGFRQCGAIVTDVELRGKYALITKTRYTGSCAVVVN